jgi:hypothetical protein
VQTVKVWSQKKPDVDFMPLGPSIMDSGLALAWLWVNEGIAARQIGPNNGF